MIALIDYGAGNLASVRKAFAAIGTEVVVADRPDGLADASGVVVPGVGHFAATRAIDERWTDAILERVASGRPLLGICLGMQWLYESSAESPELKGVGLMSGVCTRLGAHERAAPADRPELPIKVPHVGWNTLELLRDSWITEGLASGAPVYFTHSYAAPVGADTVAASDHGTRFAAIVQRGCVAGVQFHPEKSGDAGLRILRNFVSRCA